MVQVTCVKFIERMRAENIHYDFIEVMACRGGCIGGGGQPRVKLPMADKAREARIASLYYLDAGTSESSL